MNDLGDTMKKSDRDGFEIIGGAYVDLSMVVGVGQIKDDLDYDTRKVRWRFSVYFLDNEMLLQFDTPEEAIKGHEKLIESLMEYQSEVV